LAVTASRREVRNGCINYWIAANRRFGPKCDIFLTRNAVTGRRAAGSSLEDDAMKRYVTVGLTVLAGVALFEVALVPGVVIGGAAVLSCVSSDASAQCQIHTMTMEDGVMKMRPVEGGLEIKPGETVMLKPSGFHVMLVNLKHPLQQGKMVNATLKFENAGTINVEYPVAAIGAAAPGAPASEGGMKMEGHDGMKQMDKH
jgi:copper(I)-binding protein